MGSSTHHRWVTEEIRIKGVYHTTLPDRRRNAMDRLIAAHALSVGATLVTNNEADFKDYPGLKVENWVTLS